MKLIITLLVTVSLIYCSSSSGAARQYGKAISSVNARADGSLHGAISIQISDNGWYPKACDGQWLLERACSSAIYENGARLHYTNCQDEILTGSDCSWYSYDKLVTSFTSAIRGAAYKYEICQPNKYSGSSDYVCISRPIDILWTSPTCSFDTGGNVVDLGTFKMKSGRQSITRPDDLILTCDGPVTAQITATTPSESLGVRLPPGPGNAADGRYVVAAWGRTPIPVIYSFDTNVSTAGTKTHTVIYTVSIE